MVRRYGEHDIDRVIEVWNAASRVATPFLSEEFSKGEERRIREIWMPEADAWVYELAGDVAGFIALLGSEVGGLFVHPDAQRRGIGRALMDRATSLRKCLTVDVFEENEVGLGFYRGYGFGERGAFADQASGKAMVRMELCRAPDSPVRHRRPGQPTVPDARARIEGT